jgi:hypothetical protein
VTRQECAALGPATADAAAAAHNLGCVLDRLGSSGRASELLEGARALLAEVLGPSHPHALVADRNAQLVRNAAVRAVGGHGLRCSGGRGSTAADGGDGNEEDGENEEENGRGSPQAFVSPLTPLQGGREAAVRARLRGSGAAGAPGGSRRGPRPRQRDYTDLEYLGGGLYEVIPPGAFASLK